MPFPRFLGLLSGKFSFTALHALRSGNDPLEGRQISTPEVLMTKLLELDGGGEAAIKALEYASPIHVKKTLGDKTTAPGIRTSHLATTFHNYISKRRAVSCWFANQVESAAMWSAFAMHGVAIKTTVDKLKAALPKTITREFLIAAVSYLDRKDFKIDVGNFQRFSDLVLRPYLMKGLEFAHEKEVRVVTKCNEDQTWPIINVENFSKCIDEILISPYLDVSSARELKALMRAKLKSLNSVPINFSTINSVVHEESEMASSIDELLYDLNVPIDPLPLL